MKKLLLFPTIFLLLFAAKIIGQTKAKYAEPHRPQLHFSPEKRWMNDPNGLVFFENEWHLFYQFFPDGDVWGPMHWGHAVSNDLMHWKHLPIALAPDEKGMIFSGSVVIDWQNTSGFGDGKTPPMVAIFTQHLMEGEKAGRLDFQTQGIAWSHDKGRTWKKFSQNPVIKNPGLKDFRDPKVCWHATSKKWVMTLACADHLRFYTSPDLKNWELASEFGKNLGARGLWECPDLFELPVQNGKSGEKKWVLLVSVQSGSPNGGSGAQYFTGQFDGKTFTPDAAAPVRWVDYGKDNYAGVTFSDVPESDGRRIFIGWMSNWQYAQQVPTSPAPASGGESWRSAMTLPRQLFLKKDEKTGLVNLWSMPVKELERLRDSPVEWPFEMQLDGSVDLSDLGLDPSGCELIFEFDQTPETAWGLSLFNSKNEEVTLVWMNDADGRPGFFIERQNAGKTSFSPDFPGHHSLQRLETGSTGSVHIILDRSSVEVFLDGGRQSMTEIFFPNEDFTTALLISPDTPLPFKRLEMWPLHSIWRNW